MHYLSSEITICLTQRRPFEFRKNEEKDLRHERTFEGWTDESERDPLLRMRKGLFWDKSKLSKHIKGELSFWFWTTLEKDFSDVHQLSNQFLLIRLNNYTLNLRKYVLWFECPIFSNEFTFQELPPNLGLGRTPRNKRRHLEVWRRFNNLRSWRHPSKTNKKDVQ